MPSSVISSFSYNEKEQKLRVVFLSGLIYDYLDVPESVYASMKNSFAKGVYFNRYIKPAYKWERVIPDK